MYRRVIDRTQPCRAARLRDREGGSSLIGSLAWLVLVHSAPQPRTTPHSEAHRAQHGHEHGGDGQGRGTQTRVDLKSVSYMRVKICLINIR